MTARAFLLYFLFIFSLVSQVSATPISLIKNKKSQNFQIPKRTNVEIQIDGKLDEPDWQHAQQVKINNITQPYNNVSTEIETTAYIFEDGHTLYVAFDAKDDAPEDIRALLRKRDSVWNNDLVGIKLDTFNNKTFAYQFFVNPLGVQIDALENEITEDENDAWDAIWDSAGQINDDGYIVEIAIPLTAVNFDDTKDEQIWGVEMLRFVPREERLRISTAYLDPANNCWTCQLNTMTGLKDIKQGANITLTPSVVVGASQTRDVEPPKTDWDTNSNMNTSLDLKWSVTPNLSVNATLNPDFSQVEADTAQLGINNTFSLFFPEQRVFFLDNIDYFSSPWDLVYTRNIGTPNYGVKVTGQKDEHSYGLFVADDTNTVFIVPGNNGSEIAEMDQNSTNAALRYRYSPNQDFTIGWISTLRTAEDYHNYVNGVDTKIRLTDFDVITAQVVSSDTQYPTSLSSQFCDGETCEAPESITCEFGDCPHSEASLRTWTPNENDSISDLAYRINYDRTAFDYRLWTSYTEYGKDFRADLGFLTRTDFNKFVAGGALIFRADQGKWWNKFEIGGDWDVSRNSNDELLERESQIFFILNATQQIYTRVDFVDRERVGPRHDPSSLAIDGNTNLYKETFLSSFFQTRPTVEFRWDLQFDWGDAIDFANDRVGKNLLLRPRITWNPTRNTQVLFRHTYRRLRADGQEVFTANLTDIRFTYQFSALSYIRFATIISDIHRNQDNYLYTSVDTRSNTVSNQLLYSYMLNPQTVFFLGYSDGYRSDDDIISLQQRERSVFLKFSYAWLM